MLNPFALFTVLFALVATVTVASWLGALFYVALQLLAAGAVVAYLLHRTASKKVGDFWLKAKEERRVPALVLLASAVALQVSLVVFGAPAELVALMGSMLGAALLLAVITLWWKASAHAVVAGHAAVWASSVFGLWGLPFVAAVPLVMWARVAERRHTLAQVLAGAGVGAAAAVIGVAAV
ncbi:MAG: hypothetical protein WA982_04645 [Rubrobacteraceae bacterium]